MLVWTIWRSVWLVKCMKPGAGGAPAGHSFRMNGGGPCTIGGGVCGRATSDVAQVPSQRSPPLCASRTDASVKSRHASPAPVAIDRIQVLRASGNVAALITCSPSARVGDPKDLPTWRRHYAPDAAPQQNGLPATLR